LIGIFFISLVVGLMCGMLRPIIRSTSGFDFAYAVEKFQFVGILFYNSVLIATANFRAIGLGLVDKKQFPFWMDRLQSRDANK
jgi:hypothetical protein